jgi:hypothetical protein
MAPKLGVCRPERHWAICVNARGSSSIACRCPAVACSAAACAIDRSSVWVRLGNLRSSKCCRSVEARLYVVPCIACRKDLSHGGDVLIGVAVEMLPCCKRRRGDEGRQDHAGQSPLHIISPVIARLAAISIEIAIPALRCCPFVASLVRFCGFSASVIGCRRRVLVNDRKPAPSSECGQMGVGKPRFLIL